MEFNHFSHCHGLCFHQVPQGSEIHCSGCKSPGSGNFYVCWQCSYFLHEQCFRATRSLRHPSHPHHPLTLVPFPTYPSGSFFCNSCHLGGDGLSYSCSECEFDVHVHCALMPDSNSHVSPSLVPASNFSVPNDAQKLNSQPHNPIYPPQNATITNEQKSPIEPQTAIYPPHQNSSFPSANPTYPSNITLPNETQNYSTVVCPPNQYNPHHAYPQPNPTPQTFVPSSNAPTTNPPTQPNATVPTYSTVANTTTYPPPPQPSVSQPIPFQASNPQLEPLTIIKHFSHPHVLKPMEIDQTSSKFCSACEWELSGSAYCCTESNCSFNLHKACFDSPCEVRHKSHPQHPLTLLPAPPKGDVFECYACWKTGKAFAYSCTTCSHNLHIDCIQWPETVLITRPDHNHSFTLYYSAVEAGQEGSFMCDVCKNPVLEKAWRYYCRECGFRTHTGCLAYEKKQQNVSTSGKTEDVKEQWLRMQEQKAYLDLQLEMNRLTAEFIASMGNSWNI